MNPKFEKFKETITYIAAWLVPLVAIGGGVVFFLNNIWKPTIVINSVDYENGIASITANGKQQTLLSGSTNSVGNGWGIRFNDGIDGKPDRIEVVKDLLTRSTLDTKKY